MADSLPAGTVTLLFTDIEGSAALAQDYPSDLPRLLARHHALVRQAVGAHGGQVFQVVGDAFCAAFQTAPQAVRAALEAQRVLQQERWSPAAVRVRMGLHTGTVPAGALDGAPSHLAYLTLTRAQRVMAAAAGEQVLLSDATAALAAAELPDGVGLRDLGEHRLKGLLRPERLWQLVAPDLRQDFPPRPSLKAVPHNLPVPLTSFIGRERELAEAAHRLTTTRLLTLTGPGGTGKTRLSLQLAADVLDRYPHGAWLVELAALTDPALLAQTIAAVWGLREMPGRPPTAALQDYLRPKAMLLILDNCEHLVEACAQLTAELLRACPKLTVLASSREVLGITGETAYRVPSLALPDAHRPATVATAAECEAIRLFVARAQAWQPGFAVTPQNVTAVTHICRRLDGIPMALELAAARVKVLSVEQIAARLDDRFRLLTGGSRTALPRQQTLRALIDWSYDLLSAEECTALNRLSVFVGGWTLAAAEAVLGPDALDRLGPLVDKSLVVVEQASSGETRYRLLETVRQYARDKLLAAGEAEALRDGHLRHYLAAAEAAERRYQGPDMLVALDELEADLDNLRAALEWAVAREPATALRLAAALTYFWQRRGHLPEGRRWLRETLAHYPADGADDDQRRLRAKALWARGTLAWGHGDHQEARESLQASADLARALRAEHLLVNSLSMLAFAAIAVGDAPAAEAAIGEAWRVAEALDYPAGLAQVQGAQAEYDRRVRGDFAAAAATAASNVQFLRTLGDPWISAIVIMGLGVGASVAGRSAEARAHLQEAEMLFRQMRDQQMVTAAQSELAHLERREGNAALALTLYAHTLLGWQELGHPSAVAHQLECCGFIARAQAQLERAARLLGAAEMLRASAHAPLEGTERAEHAANLAALRTQLPAPALEAAWAAGRGLTQDEAIADALDAIPNA